MFLERNDLLMTLILLISFILTSAWKLHALFLYYIYFIEETTSFDKNSIILCGIEYTTAVEKISIIILVFDIKEKQLHCENYLYLVFIIVGVTTTS